MGTQMAAEAGAGVKWHESERFGLGSGNHLPDIDSHGGEDDLELVDERNVDGTENIFRQLDRFGGGGR